MMNEDVDKLLELMKSVPEAKINDAFVAALQLSEEEKETVNFAFWLCYMTENDLERAIQEAWSLSASHFTQEVNELAEKMFSEELKGYRFNEIDESEFLDKYPHLSEKEKKEISNFISTNYNQKRLFTSVTDIPYFSDKIKVQQAYFGNTDRTKLLWKINEIRNDLSHGRIQE